MICNTIYCCNLLASAVSSAFSNPALYYSCCWCRSFAEHVVNRLNLESPFIHASTPRSHFNISWKLGFLYFTVHLKKCLISSCRTVWAHKVSAVLLQEVKEKLIVLCICQLLIHFKCLLWSILTVDSMSLDTAAQPKRLQGSFRSKQHNPFIDISAQADEYEIEKCSKEWKMKE